MRKRILLDRLKPEYKQVLDRHRHECSGSVEQIEQGLSSIFYITEIPYGVVSNIDIVFNIKGKMNVDLGCLWNIFEKD
jgi:hypothetical protein